MNGKELKLFIFIAVGGTLIVLYHLRTIRNIIKLNAKNNKIL